MATLNAARASASTSARQEVQAQASTSAAAAAAAPPLAGLLPPSFANASQASADLLARLRPLALKEAERREREAKGVGKAPAGDEQEEETEEMMQLLQEARVRNDAEWRRIRTILLQLGDEEPVEAPPPEEAEQETQERQLRQKELQLRKLDHELALLETDLAALPPPQSKLAQLLDARACLLQSVQQYDEALEALRREVEREACGLDADRKLLSDLSDVQLGLQRRREMEEQREREMGADEVAAALKQKLQLVESDLGVLLNALIATSNRLFSDASARSRAQLRALLDSLMNSAWDTPAEPYVDSRKYPAALAAFLVRANVALEHSADARRLRLVGFQRGVGATQ